MKDYKHTEEKQPISALIKPRRRPGIRLAAIILAATVVLGQGGCAFAPAGKGLSEAEPPEAAGAQENAASDAAGEKENAATETGGAQKSAGPDGTKTKDGTGPAEPNGTQPKQPGDADDLTNYDPGPLQASPYARFVPLFEYGEGTWSEWLSVHALPTFMTEEEAFAVISEVFFDAGMTLVKGGELLENINLPVTNVYGDRVINDGYATIRGDLEPDGTLEELGLPVVFVSSQDVEKWNEDDPNSPLEYEMCVFYFKKAAKALAENNPDLVVFYDPFALMDYERLGAVKQAKGESNVDYAIRVTEITNEEKQAAKAETEHLLRLQAEAFIAWLEYGDEG